MFNRTGEAMTDKTELFEDRIHRSYDLDTLHKEYRDELLSEKGQQLMADKTDSTPSQPMRASEFWEKWAKDKSAVEVHNQMHFAEAYAAHYTASLRQQKDEYRDRLADVATENFSLRQQLAVKDEEIERMTPDWKRLNRVFVSTSDKTIDQDIEIAELTRKLEISNGRLK